MQQRFYCDLQFVSIGVLWMLQQMQSRPNHTSYRNKKAIETGIERILTTVLICSAVPKTSPLAFSPHSFLFLSLQLISYFTYEIQVIIYRIPEIKGQNCFSYQNTNQWNHLDVLLFAYMKFLNSVFCINNEICLLRS